MPQKRNSSEAPQVMTWVKALPVIIVAALFDAIRAFFTFFWFFGPAIAAVACTSAVNNFVDTTGKAVAVVCTTIAGVVGFYGVGITESFGVIMAMVFAFLGFLIVVFLLITVNPRMFKVNKSSLFWLSGSLGVGVIPFIGTFPAFSVVVWILYRRQIKLEKTAFKKWREEQATELMQYQAAQLAQAEIY